MGAKLLPQGRRGYHAPVVVPPAMACSDGRPPDAYSTTAAEAEDIGAEQADSSTIGGKTTKVLDPGDGFQSQPNPSGHAAQEQNPAGGQSSVIAHYQAPSNLCYLPIVVNEMVILLQIKSANAGYAIFEPVGNFVKSPEDGLRFHRTMNVGDMYDGPLDLAPWGQPVTDQLRRTIHGWSIQYRANQLLKGINQ